jgi:hypothetical protein
MSINDIDPRVDRVTHVSAGRASRPKRKSIDVFGLYCSLQTSGDCPPVVLAGTSPELRFGALTCIRVLSVIFLSISSAQAATFYIDFASGADSNAGASKAAPWKHAPGMQGCSSDCSSYSHALGDRFIFKGGVTWDHTIFPWNFVGGGNSGTYDYYGVDLAWFAGGSFTRPIFDGEYIATDMLEVNPSYVTVDNFEVKGLYLSTNVFGQFSIGLPATGFVIIQNCYVHDWKAGPGMTFDDARGGIGGSAYAAVGHNGVGTVVDNCIIENSGQSAKMNGVALRMIETVRNTTVHDVPTAIPTTTRISSISATPMETGSSIPIICTTTGFTMPPLEQISI